MTEGKSGHEENGAAWHLVTITRQITGRDRSFVEQCYMPEVQLLLFRQSFEESRQEGSKLLSHRFKYVSVSDRRNVITEKEFDLTNITSIEAKEVKNFRPRG